MLVRSRKSKGNQFEYSVKDSLISKYIDIVLTKELGFVYQFDLISEKYKIAIECKRHKGFCWNELLKIYNKLKEKAPKGYNYYLIFKSNRNPALIMFEEEEKIKVSEFKDYFGVDLIKHKGVKK